MKRGLEQIRSKIERLALDAIDRQLFAGTVIRMEQDGETLYAGAFGFSLKTAERQIPMTVETLFDLASLTKLFTTTAVLKLASEGKLELDASLADTAESKLAVQLARNVPSPLSQIPAMLNTTTARDLLTHSSGIHYWYPFYADGVGNNFASILETVLTRFPQQKTTIYSDINFMLAGMLVEQASGMALDEAMDTLVCRPLALECCAYRPTPAQNTAFAATEFGNRIEMKMVAELGLRFSGWRPLDQPIIGEADDGNCHYFFGGTAGHAGLFATAQDLCRLGSLYAGSSVLGYLPDELLREAVTDYGNGRGLGFQFGSRYPDGCGHTGFTGSFLYVNPDIKLSLSILTNRLHVPEPQNIDPFREAIVGATLEMTGAK